MASVITKYESVSVDDLHEPDYNPRVGDVETIVESLQAHGQFRPIVARVGTGEVLRGNHTLKAARQLGWERIEVAWVDVDDERARKILLADNRTSDLAVNDEQVLSELLQALPTLDGTGYVIEDVEELRRITGEIADNPTGGAGGGEPTERPRFRFMVSFTLTEAQHAAVLKRLREVIASNDDVDSPVEALVHLCREYNEKHELEVKVPELQDEEGKP